MVLQLKDIVIFMFIWCCQTESLNGCNTAREKTSYVFHIVIRHTVDAPLETLLLRKKVPVSMCKPNLACYEYSETWTKTSVKYLGDGYYELTIIIKNVTKSDEGSWELKYLGTASLKNQNPLFVCHLRVYDVSILTLENCQNIVEEGNEVHCLCKMQNETNLNMTIGWYDNNGIIFNNSDPFLIYKSVRANLGYECRGKTESGLVNQPLEYDPLVVVKSNLIECTLDTATREINISCQIQRIFPPAVCEFTFLGDDVNFETYNEHVNYKNKYWPEDDLYYSTECLIILPPMRQRNIIFSLTIYPNVTGSKNDSIYGTTQLFYLRTFHDVVNDEVKDLNILAVIFPYTFALLLLVTFLSILGIYKYLLKRYKYHKMNHKFQFYEDGKTLKQPFSKLYISLGEDFEKPFNTKYEIVKSTTILCQNNRSVKLVSLLHSTVINDSEDSEGYVSQSEEPFTEDLKPG